MNFIWRHLDFSLERSFYIQHISIRQKSLTDEKRLLEHSIELKEIDSFLLLNPLVLRSVALLRYYLISYWQAEIK